MEFPGQLPHQFLSALRRLGRFLHMRRLVGLFRFRSGGSPIKALKIASATFPGEGRKRGLPGFDLGPRA
jgi:hypothetical protein